jgi:glutaredoxin 3
VPENDSAPHVFLVTTTFCPFCVGARMLLNKRGIAFEELQIGRLDRVERVRWQAVTGGLRTFPLVRIGHRWIGGMRELYLMDRSGELGELLAESLPARKA